MPDFKTRLDNYATGDYKAAASRFKIIIWLSLNALILRNPLNLSSGLKIFVLRLFGARIGRGVVLKQSISVKYPWNLVVGDHTWIGENVWIDNLARVVIGNHVCISQGALLLTGNHDYSKESFDLMVEQIVLEDGVWIGAKSIVCLGVICGSHSILTVGSVATRNLERFRIYQGVPAVQVRSRLPSQG